MIVDPLQEAVLQDRAWIRERVRLALEEKLVPRCLKHHRVSSRFEHTFVGC